MKRFLTWLRDVRLRRRIDRRLRSGLRKSLAEEQIDNLLERTRLEQTQGRDLIARSRREWPVE